MHGSQSQLTAPPLRRKRLDRLLLERGLVETRQKGQALIMAGRVLVGGKRIDKPGTLVESDSGVEVSSAKSRFVGRGGLKLDAALEFLGWDVRSNVFLDIGSSIAFCNTVRRKSWRWM